MAFGLKLAKTLSKLLCYQVIAKLSFPADYSEVIVVTVTEIRPWNNLVLSTSSSYSPNHTFTRIEDELPNGSSLHQTLRILKPFLELCEKSVSSITLQRPSNSNVCTDFVDDLYLLILNALQKLDIQVSQSVITQLALTILSSRFGIVSFLLRLMSLVRVFWQIAHAKLLMKLQLET